VLQGFRKLEGGRGKPLTTPRAGWSNPPTTSWPFGPALLGIYFKIEFARIVQVVFFLLKEFQKSSTLVSNKEGCWLKSYYRRGKRRRKARYRSRPGRSMLMRVAVAAAVAVVVVGPKSAHASSSTEADTARWPSSLIIPFCSLSTTTLLPIECCCIHSSMNAFWSRYKIAQHRARARRPPRSNKYPKGINEAPTKRSQHIRDETLGAT
jgi:hypothetical protein